MTGDQKKTLSMLSPIATVEPGLIVPRTNLPDQLYAEIMPAEPVKLFVAGQRGMGKTTELKRFVEMLDETEFLPVFLQFGSQESITHAGLINAMARALYYLADVPVDTKGFEKVAEWYDTEESTSVIEEKSGGKAGIGGNYILLSTSGTISHDKARSTKRTRKVEKGIGQLLDRFNAFVEKTQRSAQKRIVFVVDDIDKVQDAASINSTFINASHVIGSLNCACIFTVPITYATSNFVRIAGLPYNGIHRVPGVDLFDEKGNRNTEAVRFMKQVFELRMPFNPLSPELLEQVLDSSGGVLIDAMRMLRGIVKGAILDPGTTISKQIVEDEFQHLVDDYQFVVDRPPLWDALSALCGGSQRSLVGDGILPELLYKMIAIEYRQKRTWFAAHPAARRLYEQNADFVKSLKG